MSKCMADCLCVCEYALFVPHYVYRRYTVISQINACLPFFEPCSWRTKTQLNTFGRLITKIEKCEDDMDKSNAFTFDGHNTEVLKFGVQNRNEKKVAFIFLSNIKQFWFLFSIKSIEIPFGDHWRKLQLDTFKLHFIEFELKSLNPLWTVWMYLKWYINHSVSDVVQLSSKALSQMKLNSVHR